MCGINCFINKFYLLSTLSFLLFCAYDIFLFIGLMFYNHSHKKEHKIPDSISSSSNLNLYTTIKIEITDKEK